MRIQLLACLAFAGVVLAEAPAASAAPAVQKPAAPAKAAPAKPKPAAAPASADARFKALYTKEWAWRETELAHADEGDAVPIQPYLPKVDAASQTRRLVYWRYVRQQLDAIKESSLSPEQAVNYQIYRDQLDTLISQQKF
ncbi:MAG: hypothetical protein ACREEG_09950, partial [Phenylobacterium sp.]